jgi:hypothetical protein
MGEEEPAGKEGHGVGWLAMLSSCPMRPPTGGLDGEPGRDVGKVERDRENGGIAHKGKKLLACCLALPTKKNKVEFFHVHRLKRVEA